MNIGIVTDTYRPRVNGVVTSIDTFATEYRKMGHEVTIIAPEFPSGQKDFKDDENEKDVIRINSHYIFFDPEDRLPDPWTPSARKKINSEILARRFDVLHTQTPFPLGIDAARWAKKMKCPVVHTYHTMFESYAQHYIKFLPKQFSHWYSKEFSKWYCNKMDLIITPSTQMHDLLKSYGVKPPIEVNPTGIKIDNFKKYDGADFRKKNNIPADTILFLFMGRIGHEKNIPFLFDALKKVREKLPGKTIKLMVAGKGPAEEAVRAAAKEKGVENDILWFGYFEPQDWVNCYAAADLFTFSSVTETQGLVVTEAMAVGTPVVAVGEMGVAEVMAGDRGGILVDLNLDHFVDAVVKMMTDKTFYNAKRKEAFDYAREWSAEAMAKKMLDKFEKVIAAKKANKGK
ncbi:MAG: glycosyltransferase [Spirochaetia bacterium]|nr:glycosyltransferase [Spirochaetia bacterium]